MSGRDSVYIPKAFEVTDEEEIFSFIQANAFGQLISMNRGELFSTHIPFLLSDDRSKVLGHIAKQNPQQLDIENQQVLVTLDGPHDYISPSWYGAPGVPTWNYQSVHLYGACKLVSDPEEVRHIVEALSHKYESGFESPWIPDYSDSKLSAIVGIEVSIDRMQCKYKLSQNRPAEDRDRVISRLEASGAAGLAAAMRRCEQG